MSDAQVLGQEVKLPFSGRVAPSRFMKGAMTERLSSWDQHRPEARGIPSDGLVKVYEEWGNGGFGIVLSGNTIVDPVNLEAPGNAIIHEGLDKPEEREKQFRRLFKAGKGAAGKSLFVVQLSHGGRQVADALTKNPVSASDIPCPPTMGYNFAKPTPLDEDGIKKVVNDFAYAAQKCHEWGADGIQLHAAHGYLLAQFLSSTTNKRTDKYGGSLENRARIIYDIFEEIDRRISDPKFIKAIKINSVEFQEGGFQPEESAAVCKHLEQLGVDVIELSGGTYESLAFTHKRESTKAREGFFLQFAETIRQGVSKSRIWTTGGFRSAKAMADAVRQGVTDGVGIARPATQDFGLPSLIISGKVDGARKGLLPEHDFGITNVAAGTQIRQVANGIQPFDATNEEAVQKFKEEVGQFMEIAKKDGAEGVVKAGYPDLAGSAYQPISLL
ncbi:NADH oxidase [Ceraceosorus guamensis]|uniref:NADH oxidase n=1 Tax=Ceraceosorus guamensis TaxID=1522189 RepID=A0A316VYE1_9BASI|nr:NADH oxidase [Ceraceosorus guamensis]PWN41928.1 NADH oxidase [Ceraceosorus guamensis]